VTRLEIVKELSQGIHNVTFTKVDGTERTMPCTLDPTLLPTVELIESEDKRVPRKLNMDTLRVFVTDIKEWRSFRIENLKSIRGV
jgi:hypothetical protein